MKRIWILVLILTFFTAGHRVRAETPSVAVKTVPAKELAIHDVLTVYGRVQPDPDAVQTIALSHAGLITRVAVRLGQRVKRDDDLFEMQAAPDAYNQYLQARDAVDYAVRELKRQEQLLNEHLATRSQVDTARKALTDARSNLRAMQAQGANKARQTLKAPVDGIVTALAISRGDRVQADTAALAIAGSDRLIAVLGVEPEDLPGLHVGTPVKLHSVFASHTIASSHLSDLHAMINPQTGLVDVLAPIPPEKAERFIIGSYLTADLLRDAHTGIAVPRSAVLRDGKGTYLFSVVQGKARRITVRTGIEQNGWIEILSGVKAGQPVVVSGNHELTHGMAVREAR
jgi:RND family efflux transporter MFP subunit